MKSSVILAAACALVATASPLGQRALVVDWVVKVTTVTVTVEETEPTPGVYVEALPETSTIPVVNSVAPKPTVQTSASPLPPAPEPKTIVQTSSAPPAVPVAPSPSAAPESKTSVQAAAPALAAPNTQTIVPAPSSPAPKPAVQAPPSSAPAPAPAPQPTTTVAQAPPVVQQPSTSTLTAQPTQGSSSGNDYSSIMVNEHNIHRRNHSASDLQWDNTLAGYAQISANKCVFQHDMTEGNGGYGQNIAAWGGSGDISNLQESAARAGVTDMWYNDEMENWQYYGQANPPSGINFDTVGHFTQLVWKGSTTLGCATVSCPAGSVLSLPSWFTVCNYGPAGNYGGEYGTNVLPPLGEAMVVVAV